MSTGVEGTGEIPALPPLAQRSQEHRHGVARAEDAPDHEMSVQFLERVVDDLNQTAQALKTHLAFSIDSSTGKTVVTVVDTGTGEVIRQIPPEETLRLAARIREMLGVLLDEEV